MFTNERTPQEIRPTTLSIMDRLIEKKLYRKQVELLLAQSVSPCIANIVIVLFIAMLFWSQILSGEFFSWVVYMSIASVYRLFVLLKAGNRLNRYLEGTYLVAAGWGCVLFFTGEIEPQKQLYLLLALLGVSAGAMPVMSLLKRAFIPFILIIAIPTIVFFLTHESTEQKVFGVFVTVYSVFLITIARKMYNDRRRSLRLAIENSDLATKVIREKNMAESANLQLKEEILSRKQAELKLKEAKENAETAHLAKTNFLANMSHEIRTPMNTIVGMTKLALETDLTPIQQKYIQSALSSTDTLLSMLNGIFDFSIMEMGRAKLDLVEFDLIRLIEETVKSYAEVAHKKNLELVIDIRDRANYMVKGDLKKVREALLNLLSNAIKFTESGTIVVRLTLIKTVGETKTFRIDVEDTGIGMPKEFMPKLFESFTQADSSKTRKFGGIGLGTTLVKKMVELMGGVVEVESEQGKGSTFSFTLPLTVTQNPSFLKLSSSRMIEAKSALLLTDQESTKAILKRLLTQFSISVTCADDLEHALQLLKERRNEDKNFDLVYCGIGVISNRFSEKIEEILKQTPDSGLVLLTTTIDVPDKHELKKINHPPCLTMPISIADLLAASKDAVIWKEDQDRSVGRILLVEDNKINARLVRTILKKKGLEIDWAENGQIGLEMYQHSPYGLVLMDVQMPVMGGCEATEKIRALKNGKDIPIVAMTGGGSDEEKANCLNAGMNEVLIKPIDIKKIQYVLETYLGIKTVDTQKNDTATEKLSLPNYPGIDFEQGIYRWSNAKQVYLKALKDFSAKHRGDGEKIEELKKLDDHASIMEIAHALKGVAGNMSAMDITKIAGEIESACREKQPMDHLVKKLVDLEKAFNTLEEAIVEFEKIVSDEKNKNRQAESGTGSPSIDVDFIGTLNVVVDLLEHGIAVEAAALLEKFTEKLRREGLGSDLENVLDHIDNFNFSRAIEGVNQLKVHNDGESSNR